MAYPLPLSVPDAREIALGSRDGRLGEPSKMPGFTIGISASECKRGAILAQDPNTPCAHCYALSKFYLTKHEVQIAHARRLQGLKHPLWVEAMTTLILHHADPADPYFRWHDSGDLQGVWHLANIVQVCIRTPWVMHWLPTHEPHMVREYLASVETSQAPAIPDNLCIRISADLIGTPPERIEGLEAFPISTVHRGHGPAHLTKIPNLQGLSIECPSYKRSKGKQGVGVCGNCRACWDPDVAHIGYPLHGEKRGKYQLPLAL